MTTLTISMLCAAMFSLDLTGGHSASGKVNTTCSTYEHYIIESARRHSIEPEIVAALIYSESRWTPDAVSSKGACGLMQVVPRWARSERGRRLTCDDLKDPAISIETGTAQLARWRDEINGGDMHLALCSYATGADCKKNSKRVRAGKRYANFIFKTAAKIRERSQRLGGLTGDI